MKDFMNMKYQNSKLKQSEIASQLDMSSSTIQRHRNDINMLSPYGINPNNVKNDQKRPKSMIMVTSNDFKRPQDNFK